MEFFQTDATCQSILKDLVQKFLVESVPKKYAPMTNTAMTNPYKIDDFYLA